MNPTESHWHIFWNRIPRNKATMLPLGTLDGVFRVHRRKVSQEFPRPVSLIGFLRPMASDAQFAHLSSLLRASVVTTA